jgi:S-adenosylmethionine:tRNA ribosyltransferase-isomerase
MEECLGMSPRSWFHSDGPDPRVQTDAFDFDLPDALIAQHPVEPRDASRLLVVHRGSGTWEHRDFRELPDLLAPGDLLVRNNTRVIPARLVGRRESTGGAWEGLFLRVNPEGTWEILSKTRGRPRPGEHVVVGSGLRLELLQKDDSGRWTVRPDSREPVSTLLERHGVVPLPPYIRKGVEGQGDRARYQTVFAAIDGSVAAPTAGLHFTDDVFHRLDARGIGRVDLTLHVGLGTFRPIEADRIEDHSLHAEWASLSIETAERINRARAERGRIVAVGTTSARTLETAAKGGLIAPFDGETSLYIQPGHPFRAVDALLTNFHLPRSSLLVLVAALSGYDLMRAAYAEAIRERYRFYSYGDAMLVIE